MFDILKGKRVFIIEDKVTNLTVMQLLLEQYGVVIGFERWGMDTVPRLLKFQPIDLILLDLMFPRGVSGYDVFDKIREEAGFAAVPIVAVSAGDASSVIPRLRGKGFSGFIAKPIEYEAFPRQVAELLIGGEVWES